MQTTNSLFQKYNPRLDGLRALAVMIVIGIHFRIPGFLGGAYGVDIFFVLSGFLITLVLIKGQEKGESLFVFYWRRFLRLMPALLFMCLSFLVFSLLFGKMIPFGIAFRDVFDSITYMANWTRTFEIGTPIIPIFLGNTWSLAIEEQFYLLWAPLFLLLYTTKSLRKHIIAITTAILFFCFFWSIYAWFGDFGPSRLFDGFDTRCFVLIMGCCLALYSQSSYSERFFIFISKLWPLAVIGLIYLVNIDRVYDNYLSLLTGIVTVIFILSAYYRPESLFGKFLGLKPMVAIGKISYALYLWHYPIWLILNSSFRLSWAATAWIGIPLSFVAAIISYYLVEKNLSRFRDSPALPLKNLGAVTLSLEIILMLAGSIYFLHGPIGALLSPKPITIQAYSPMTVKAGSTVNFQPDGQSYFFLVASQQLRSDTKLRIDNQDQNVILSNNIIATPLSPALLSRVGTNEVVLVSSIGNSLAPPVYFQVTEK
jgi:peptidoglycan/LPS O-acetylase OafA/YrhL